MYIEAVLVVLLVTVALVSVTKWRQLFVPRFARAHRLIGALYLTVLLMGAFDVLLGWGKQSEVYVPAFIWYAAYDMVLGILGVALAWTAAVEFGRVHADETVVRRTRQSASGALDVNATVTKSEMIEHVFYQLLNLFQAILVHSLPLLTIVARPNTRFCCIAELALLAMCTCPWLVRSWFPVNSFSANWSLKQQHTIDIVKGFNNKRNNGMDTTTYTTKGVNAINSNVINNNYDDGDDVTGTNGTNNKTNNTNNTNVNEFRSTNDNDNVNTTRKNTKVVSQTASEETRTMYKVKKAQYLLYKHFLLHGLNISIVLHQINESNKSKSNTNNTTPEAIAVPHEALGMSAMWRLHWISLNAAYTLEFFLQTLVRRRVLPQRAMLWMNQILMCVCTVASGLVVIQHVRFTAAAVSLFLNFSRRHKELSNVALAFLAAYAGDKIIQSCT
eukprot:m.119444 g.119444  ORF g.119444 m.119444 type:complete len:444 (+) comp28735_c1_seq3:255-1586(+)